MVHQSTRCKKLQRVFYCNLSKKVQSGAPSGDENSSGPPPVRRAKTPQWGVFRARESPRWCTKECLTRKCRAFFGCSILRRHDLVHRRRYSNRAAARKCCKERHSAAFLSPRESPRECGGCGKARRWGEAGP